MAETVRHNKPEGIWLMDYASLATMDDCPEFMVWLSERDLNIIWQATLNIDKFRSRVFTEAHGTEYKIVNRDQFSEYQEWVSDMNVHTGGYLMCNDILQSIAASLEQLVDKPCCPSGGSSGSRGSGSAAEPANPYDQGETPTEPPPGFSSMEEYDGRKCNAAQDLINNLRGDLLGLSGLVYSGATPTGLVGILIFLLLTPIPFDELIALAAYLIYSAYSYAFLAEMSAQMGDSNEDLLCVLYNADSAAIAQTDFLAELEEIALAYFTTEDDAQWVMGAIEYMLQYDAFNVLFENIPTTSTAADCSGCGSDTGCFAVVNGTLASGTIDPLSSVFVVESVAGPDVGGTGRHWINMKWVAGCGCIQLGIESDGFTAGDLEGYTIGNLAWFCGDETYTIEFSEEPDIWNGLCFIGEDTINNLQFNSRTAFSITFTVIDLPCV